MHGARHGRGCDLRTGAEEGWRLSAYGRLLLALLLLVGATLAVQLGSWRYLPAPAAAVDDHLASPRGWQLSRGVSIAPEAGAPVASLAAGGRFTYLGRLVRPEPGVAHTRFSLELKTENLEGRSFDNRTVIVRVSSFNQERRRMRHWPHEVVEGMPRDHDWTRAALVVPWTPEVAMMRLEIVNVGKTGALKVRHVGIEPLVDAPWHGMAQWVLIVAWIGLAGVAAVMAARRLRPLRFGLAVAITGLALLVAAVLPQPVFDNLAGPFEEPLIAIVRASSQILPQRAPKEDVRPASQPAPQSETAVPAPRNEAAPPASPPSGVPTTVPRPPDAAVGPAMTGADAMEIARDGASWLRRQVEGNTLHAAGFGFLALLSIGLAKLPFLRVVLAVAAMAVATEAVQLFTITRDADVTDLAVDATGALAGLLAGFVLRRLLGALRSRLPSHPVS